MIDLLFHDRAVHIVCAEAQSDLRNAGREHDPVCLDVIEIIEHQPGDRDVAQIVVAGGLRNVRKRRIVRMKRQRNEGDEAVGFVLRFAQLHEVVDAFFYGFHMAVKHGGVGTQADAMSLFGHVEPHAAADLVVADDSAHAGMENFRAAAGTGIHARFLHLEQRFVDGKLSDAREIVHLDHREGFQVHVRDGAASGRESVRGKNRNGRSGCRPPTMWNSVAPSRTPCAARSYISSSVKVYAPGESGIAAKGAKLAVRDADVGGIDVAIDVVIGDVAVALFADVVGQPADGKQIGRLVERDAVVKGEALAREDFVGDGFQVRVGDGQFSHARV